jgi:hypothetical protein
MAELTKEYFDQQISTLATKADLEGVKTEVSTMNTDVSTLKSDMKEIKETVLRIDKRDKEDSNAFAKDIVLLQKDVKHLKLKHA